MTNQLCHKDERFNDLPGGVVGFFAKQRSKSKKRKSKKFKIWLIYIVPSLQWCNKKELFVKKLPS